MSLKISLLMSCHPHCSKLFPGERDAESLSSFKKSFVFLLMMLGGAIHATSASALELNLDFFTDLSHQVRS